MGNQEAKAKKNNVEVKKVVKPPMQKEMKNNVLGISEVKKVEKVNVEK